jgi:hypothetical protein
MGCELQGGEVSTDCPYALAADRAPSVARSCIRLAREGSFPEAECPFQASALDLQNYIEAARAEALSYVSGDDIEADYRAWFEGENNA